MEKLNFDCSTKNIPIPNSKDYIKRFIGMTEKLIKRMRWRAFYFLNPNAPTEQKETYGFNSSKTPPQIPELNDFENKMTSLIQSIEFRAPRQSEFQDKLHNCIQTINKNENMYVPADKTTNYYKLSADEYELLLKKNIEKQYKKTSTNTENTINGQAKNIAQHLQIADRVEMLARKDAFITLKDHKDNFQNNPTCRLINPAKSELGKVSKQITEKINRTVISKTGVHQWKNTKAMLNWFNNTPNKAQCSFIAFDVVNFYPSISCKLLSKALEFAATHVNISEEDKQIILHAKQSLLFKGDDAWTKKNSPNTFDVTMGSFDGAETCELVGSYILCQLPEFIRNQIGLYRDDGLGIFNERPRQIESIKKSICKAFTDNGLKITIEANKKIVNFLDVTLDLQEGTHAPFTKPNNTPLYIHLNSNHPPSITKNIPVAINKRLNEISSNKHLFDNAAPAYQNALRNSGYKHQLAFEQTDISEKPKSKNRKRNITWFNPPFSQNVSTNIGKRFLNIVKESFKNEHPLRKIFNRNTLKVSYSCMPNLERKINDHNKSILGKTLQSPAKKCNCRTKTNCPMNGECLINNVIYQATVVTDNKAETYIGLTGDQFKTRFRNHTASFKDRGKKHATELSKYIWSLKDANTEYTLNWKIMARANSYSNRAKKCNLCITEKYFIIRKPELCTLNRRNELVSTCRHAKKYLLINA